jgi:hypothetical protein
MQNKKGNKTKDVNAKVKNKNHDKIIRINGHLIVYMAALDSGSDIIVLNIEAAFIHQKPHSGTHYTVVHGGIH